jgi:hypothetical protein
MPSPSRGCDRSNTRKRHCSVSASLTLRTHIVPYTTLCESQHRHARFESVPTRHELPKSNPKRVHRSRLSCAQYGRSADSRGFSIPDVHLPRVLGLNSSLRSSHLFSRRFAGPHEAASGIRARKTRRVIRAWKMWIGRFELRGRFFRRRFGGGRYRANS